MSSLTAAQVEYLLRPIQSARVSRDPGGNSYLPQHDIRAHLNRVFGFGNWSTHVVESAMVFEEPVTWTKSGLAKSGYDALWRATVRLSIRDHRGEALAEYEDAATGDAQHQTRLAAHDLALKSAVSTALKRAATCLGDQFGLSLYNKGSEAPFVLFTLIWPEAGESPATVTEPPAGTPEEQPEDTEHVQEAATPPPEPVDQPLVQKAKRRAWKALGALHPTWDNARATAEITDLLGLIAPADATVEDWEALASEFEAEKAS